EYEIIEWNEDNFDIHLNKYTEMCYEQKNYAFLSDYVRLRIIYEHGGIYLDTDVEVIKSLDGLLNNKAYFGFEDNEHVNTGVGFGAEKKVK
ncbi:MAG: glycosyl transferase, partial [Erysipelotrichaceae bacterium]|nr:glycosyl transferase [Erysipelotrichaceae bacterium]